MAITITSLINTLQDIADQYGEDTQIICAHQPSYPLAEVLSSLVVTKYANGDMVNIEPGMRCEPCYQATKSFTEAVMYDDDTEMSYCAKCASENGFDAFDEGHEDTGDSGAVAWLLLGGTPEYGGYLHTNPYAPRALWDETVGETFQV